MTLTGSRTSILHRLFGGTLAAAVAVSLVLPAAAAAVPASARPASSNDATAPASASAATSSTAGAAVEPTSPLAVAVDEETLRFRRELAVRQAKLREFQNQLDQLDRDLEIAQEAYNASAERLSATREVLTETELDLSKARVAYEVQLDLLDSRAESIYRGGEFVVIDLLLDAKSVSDLIARIKFLNTLGMRDLDLAQHLASQRDLLEETAVRLRSQKAQAEALEFELKARQIEILLRVQERQTMVAAVQAEILDLMEAEAARRQEEQAELLLAILSGASDAGITIDPGSPVETALAYHGIPYLWGGETPAGFDCSGLVLYVFRQHGVRLPHYSGSQFLLGDKIGIGALKAGDVVFFGSPVHHVGIYVGGGYFLHAPRTGDFVKLSRLADRSDFAGARRYQWVARSGPIAGMVSESIADSGTVSGLALPVITTP